MDETKALPELVRLSQYLHPSNMLFDFLRWLGFAVLKGELWLSDQIYQAVGGIYKYLDLYQYLNPKFAPFIKPLGSFALLVAIIVVAFMLFRGKIQEAGSAPMNIVMIGIILMILPTLASQVINLVNPAQSAITQEYKNPAETVFRSTITDLYVLGEKNWDTKKAAGLDGNRLTKQSEQFLNIDEKITDESDVKNGDVLGYEISIPKDETKKSMEAVKMDHGNSIINGFTNNMLGNFYYRYSWHPFITGILIALIAIAGLLTGVRSAVLIYKFASDFLWASLVLWVKIHTFESAKQFLTGLMGVPVTLIFLSYNYYIYGAAIGYVVNEKNLLTLLFLVAGFTIASLDAPTLLQKVLGIDTGLKSIAGSIVGGIIAAKAIKNGAENGAKKVAGALSGGAEGAAFLGGFFSGGNDIKTFADEMKEKKNQQQRPGETQNKTPNGPPNDGQKQPSDSSARDKNQAQQNQTEQKEQNNQAQPAQDQQSKQEQTDQQPESMTSPEKQAPQPNEMPMSDEDASLFATEPPDADSTDEADQTEPEAPNTDSASDDQAVPPETPSEDAPDTDTTVGDDPASEVTESTDAPQLQTKSDLDRNQQIAAEKREAPGASDHMTPKPTPKNPIVTATRDYLDTPKAERHAAHLSERMTNAYTAGRKLGNDFEQYGHQKQQTKATDRKARDEINDFRKYSRK